MKRLFAGILLLVLAFSANATTIHPVVSLMALKAVQTAEKNGDELYLAVTVYPSKGKPKHYQVPKYPLHWASTHLDQINNLKVWDGTLPVGRAVTLILSLVEQDSPPWNTDDLIGSVRIRLRNNNGHLESSWSMPNRVDAPVSILTKEGRAEKFQLLGENSNYLMFLNMKVKD